MKEEAAIRKPDPKSATFVLVRAGETEFSRLGRIEGDVDVPLTARGRIRARRVAEDVIRPMGGVDAVYTAENQGARETAEILAAANPKRIRVLDELRGVSFGLWEGQLVADVRQRHGRIWERWMRDPLCITPPEGEEIGRAFRRVGAAWKAIRRRHRVGNVAVVAPSAVISLFSCHLSGRPPSDVFRLSGRPGSYEIVSAQAGRVGS